MTDLGSDFLETIHKEASSSNIKQSIKYKENTDQQGQLSTSNYFNLEQGG